MGSGLGVGTRRNTTQIRKRLKAFVRRRTGFKRLMSFGFGTDCLLRLGWLSSTTFGQRALGVADATLAVQRRAPAAATCVSRQTIEH